MVHRIWLLAFLLVVPGLGFLLAEGVQMRQNSQLRALVRQQVPTMGAGQLAQLNLDDFCSQPNAADSEVCMSYARTDVMSLGSLATGAAGIVLVLLIALAGAVARGNRSVLALIFKPGLYLTAAILAILICAHAVLLITVVYVAEALLINRIHLGVILTVGLGALGGVFAVIRGVFSIVKKAETLAVGKSISRQVAPGLWQVVETSAHRLDALAPDTVVIGLDPNFFVTEANVITLDGKLSGRTLYCSMPLARILTVDEFTAVIGHELGHFRGEDTKFSERFYPIYRGAANALQGLQAAGGGGLAAVSLLPAIAVFGYFLNAFAAAESRLGRERELVADQAGASVTNARVVATSLVKVHAFAEAWGPVQRAAAAAMQQGRIFENVSRVFADAVATGATRAAIDSVSTRHISHPTDSHPPLASRLESLAVTLDDVADDALQVSPSQAAASLIPNLEKWEAEISVAYQALLARQLGINVRAAASDKRTGITTCDSCHTRVLPQADGSCPGCGKPVKSRDPGEVAAV